MPRQDINNYKQPIYSNIMAVDFHFIPVEDRKTLDKLISFLRPQGLDYQNWEVWIEKAFYEILAGYKQSIIVESNGAVIGNVISQLRKELGWIYEGKNLRVLKGFRDSGCATFLEKQVEKRARKHGAKAVIWDYRSEKKWIGNFFIRRGYAPILENWPLYDNNHPDTIMIKNLNKKSNAGIIQTMGEFFLGRAV
jgi:hypothetical protein